MTIGVHIEITIATAGPAEMSRAKRSRRKEHIRRCVIDNGLQCYYCGWIINLIEITVDHVIPIDQSGGQERGNVVIACRDCNLKKSNMSADEFRVYLWVTGSRRGGRRKRTFLRVASRLLAKHFTRVTFAGELRLIHRRGTFAPWHFLRDSRN